MLPSLILRRTRGSGTLRSIYAMYPPILEPSLRESYNVRWAEAQRQAPLSRAQAPNLKTFSKSRPTSSWGVEDR